MAIHLWNLKKTYYGPDGSIVPVVDIAELTLEPGEQVALVGSSGSGKTTLLHLIAGILTPDSGRILFDTSSVATASPGATGSLSASAASTASANPAVLPYQSPSADGNQVDLTELTEAQRDVFRGRYMGYIFQTHHLLAGFTAMENVLLGMSFTGRRHDRQWAHHLLKEVGLSDRLDYKPEKLSVGQQQRVAVARALANRPKLVLADEPTGALDPVNARQVLGLIRNLCTEVGATLLLVSHDPAITAQFPRVLHLADLNRAAQPAAQLTPQVSNLKSEI